MLERAQEHTRLGKFTNLEYARFADDLVILINAHPRHGWVLKAVAKRLREELVKLDVQINEEKSRTVDLGELLCHWLLESLLPIRQALGRDQSSAALAAGPEMPGPRLGTVENAVAARHPRAVQRLPGAS